MKPWAVILLCVVVSLPASASAAERWESERHDVAIFDITLMLNDDGTYRFANQTGSCWIDWDERGTWLEEESGLVILTSDTGTDWPTPVARSMDDPNVAGMRVTLIDDRGEALSGTEIGLGSGAVMKVTDSRGRVEFTPAELKRVVGQVEWITFVSEKGAGFVVVQRDANAHQIGLSRRAGRRVSYFFRDGATLKGLGGLGIAFERCPEP